MTGAKGRLEHIACADRNRVKNDQRLDSLFSPFDMKNDPSVPCIFNLYIIQDIWPMKLFAKYLEAFFEKGRRLHLFFCTALLILLVFVLLLSRSVSHIAVGLFYYGFVLSCIYTGRWLCRRWLLVNKWVGLVVAVVIALVGYTIVGVAGFIYFFSPQLPANHILESAINIVAGSSLLIFSGFFVAVIRSAIREKLNGLILAEQKKESELGLLRSQVSPHFLFNTLNNMYSLSINRPAQMPALLLRLSELLRYSVYEADQPVVTLREELEYIRNYIALENIRCSDRLLLGVNIEDPPDGVRIAPMLLIVFVENAFKHARNTTGQYIYITINLSVSDGIIYFDVENNCGEEISENTVKKRNSGFGVENVIKRLDLLYPGGYGLKQTCINNQFKVELWLKEKQ